MSAPQKIVFFGTSVFAVPVLESLTKNPEFEVTLAVTRPDKPAGRKLALTGSPLKRAAERLHIPIYQPETLRTPEVVERLAKEKADAFVIASYGKMIPMSLLDVPRKGCINVHGSILPAYRGASPISAAIMAGDAKTGATIMLMDEKLDEGPILSTREVDIRDDDTTETLEARVAQAGAEILEPALKFYLTDGLVPKPQDHSKATYTKIKTKDDGRIDWMKSAAEIERKIRAMRPWPEAWTVWERKGKPMKLAIVKAAVMNPDASCSAGGPGSVCRLNDGTIGANCGRGSIAISRVQPEGKAEMDAKDFLNGYRDFVDATLS